MCTWKGNQLSGVSGDPECTALGEEQNGVGNGGWGGGVFQREHETDGCLRQQVRPGQDRNLFIRYGNYKAIADRGEATVKSSGPEPDHSRLRRESETRK